MFHVLIVSVNKYLSTAIQFLTVDAVLFIVFKPCLRYDRLSERRIIALEKKKWTELKNYIITIIIIVITFAEYLIGHLSVETHNT